MALCLNLNDEKVSSILLVFVGLFYIVCGGGVVLVLFVVEFFVGMRVAEKEGKHNL